eukprot:295661-Rhodomonas_salina.1
MDIGPTMQLGQVTGFEDYQLQFTVLGETLDPFVSPAFAVVHGSFHHLAVSVEPQGIQAGQTFSPSPIVELRDMYDNIVHASSESKNIKIDVKQNTYTVAPNRRCSGQTCTGGGSEFFCANKEDADMATTHEDCLELCRLNPRCVAITFYEANTACPMSPITTQPFKGPLCDKSYQCYLAFDSCSSTEDASGGSVHFGARVSGTNEGSTNSGYIEFDQLLVEKTGTFTLEACTLSGGACQQSVETISFQVHPATVVGIQVIEPGLPREQHWGQVSYAPADVVAFEPFSVAVRLTDSFDNTVNDAPADIAMREVGSTQVLQTTITEDGV